MVVNDKCPVNNYLLTEKNAKYKKIMNIYLIELIMSKTTFYDQPEGFKYL